MCNSHGASCAHKGKTGTDKSAEMFVQPSCAIACTNLNMYCLGLLAMRDRQRYGGDAIQSVLLMTESCVPCKPRRLITWTLTKMSHDTGPRSAVVSASDLPSGVRIPSESCGIFRPWPAPTQSWECYGPSGKAGTTQPSFIHFDGCVFEGGQLL